MEKENETKEDEQFEVEVNYLVDVEEMKHRQTVYLFFWMVFFAIYILVLLAFFARGQMDLLLLYFLIAALLVIYVVSSYYIVYEYERAILFRFGKFVTILSPGLNFIWRPFYKLVKVDLRVVTDDVPKQEVITSDNVTVYLDAVIFYNVVEPAKAIMKVEDYRLAISKYGVTILRSIVGKSELDTLLSRREEVNMRIREVLRNDVEAWGIEVSGVEIKDIVLPADMKRAMAKQSEAERERRARIILASGEYEASKKLKLAADLMAQQPAALQLRLYQTMLEMSEEKSVHTIIAMPQEILRSFGLLGEILKEKASTG